jgi:hypothetical protein
MPMGFACGECYVSDKEQILDHHDKDRETLWDQWHIRWHQNCCERFGAFEKLQETLGASSSWRHALFVAL